MRRRSTIAPVREDEVLGSSFKPSRPSFAPRQLPFSKVQTDDPKIGKVRRSISGRASIRPSFIGKSNESLHDASVLAHTITEEDCTVVNPNAIARQVTYNAVPQDRSNVTSRASIRPRFTGVSNESQNNTQPTSEMVSVVNPKVSSSKLPQNDPLAKYKNQRGMGIKSVEKNEARIIGGSTQTSNRVLSDSKIPKPKIYSASKPSSPGTQLNTTAAFEEVEIAALTSTPHPERSSRRRTVLTSNINDSEVKLFLSEQRSVMQAMKLSFQKFNLVLDSQQQVNIETARLLKEIRFNAMSKHTLNSTENVDDLALACSEKISLCLNNRETEMSFKKELSSCQEDKENVLIGGAFKPDSLYRDMKSQLGCLKTPTVHRTVKPMCAETPNTFLSNTVHHQLESLFEDNDVRE